MLDYIERLRKKPIAYRKRVLLLTTSVITGLIFIFWLSTFNLFFQVDEVDPSLVEEQLRPIEEIKTSALGFVEFVKEMGAGFFGSSTSTPLN